MGLPMNGQGTFINPLQDIVERDGGSLSNWRQSKCETNTPTIVNFLKLSG